MYEIHQKTSITRLVALSFSSDAAAQALASSLSVPPPPWGKAYYNAAAVERLIFYEGAETECQAAQSHKSFVHRGTSYNVTYTRHKKQVTVSLNAVLPMFTSAPTLENPMASVSAVEPPFSDQMVEEELVRSSVPLIEPDGSTLTTAELSTMPSADRATEHYTQPTPQNIPASLASIRNNLDGEQLSSDLTEVECERSMESMDMRDELEEDVVNSEDDDMEPEAELGVMDDEKDLQKEGVACREVEDKWAHEDMLEGGAVQAGDVNRPEEGDMVEEGRVQAGDVERPQDDRKDAGDDAQNVGVIEDMELEDDGATFATTPVNGAAIHNPDCVKVEPVQTMTPGTATEHPSSDGTLQLQQELAELRLLLSSQKQESKKKLKEYYKNLARQKTELAECQRKLKESDKLLTRKEDQLRDVFLEWERCKLKCKEQERELKELRERGSRKEPDDKGVSSEVQEYRQHVTAGWEKGEMGRETDDKIFSLTKEGYLKDGKLILLRELMENYRGEAESARRQQEKAEGKLVFVEQQLLARSLLGEMITFGHGMTSCLLIHISDDFTIALRSAHNALKSNSNPSTASDPAVDPKKDEIGRRRLLQHCTCDACSALFNHIHRDIVQSFHLGNSFTVQEMRITLGQCWDRFCKVAHPMEKMPIKLDAFQDDWIRRVLWGIAAFESWRTEGR
ncbi:hypothetical protein HDV00_000493 [Rhizophlyctis rosea]|nr:hypothetical protein HDV00_000493 [Rhizophlyctis rosea]